MNSKNGGKPKNIKKSINNLINMLKYNIISLLLYILYNLIFVILSFKRYILAVLIISTIGCGYSCYKDWNIRLLFACLLSILGIVLVLIVLPSVLKVLKNNLQKYLQKYYYYKGNSLQTNSKPIATSQNNKAQDDTSSIYMNQINHLKETISQLKNEKNNLQKQDHVNQTDFFVGTSSSESIKKRYKELVKIYHSDVPGGDSDTIAEINKQYEYKMKGVV